MGKALCALSPPLLSAHPVPSALEGKQTQSRRVWSFASVTAVVFFLF